MLAVLKKEFKSYLLTPLGYVFIGMFLLVFSFLFYSELMYCQQFYNPLSFEDFFRYNGATVLTFVIPVLTMRMFSEERKTGTEQLILTSPRSLTSVVLGKFFSAVLIMLITEVITFMYFGIMQYFGQPSFIVAISTLIGYLLLGAAYISFGMFASSITESQIVAFILSLGVFIAMWFLPNINSIFIPFSLMSKFDNFPEGIISISEIISFASFIILFILLTIIVLQTRKSSHR